MCIVCNFAPTKNKAVIDILPILELHFELCPAYSQDVSQPFEALR